MRRVAALLLAGALVALAACSGESNDPSSSQSSQRSRTQAARARKAAATAKRRRDPGCRFLVMAQGKRETAAPPVLEYLSAATATSTACYDKITFTFEPGDNNDLPPGYTVEYRKPPFAESFRSTTEGFADAKAILYVEFRFVDDFDARQAGPGRQTYRGNQRLQLEGVHHARIVEWLKDLPDPTPEIPTDNKVVWLIGLDEKRPFTVDAATQPPHVDVLIKR